MVFICQQVLCHSAEHGTNCTGKHLLPSMHIAKLHQLTESQLTELTSSLVDEYQQNVFQLLEVFRSIWEDVECKLRCIKFRRVLDRRRKFQLAFRVTGIFDDWYRSTLWVIVISLGTPQSARENCGWTWGTVMCRWQGWERRLQVQECREQTWERWQQVWVHLKSQ